MADIEAEERAERLHVARMAREQRAARIEVWAQKVYTRLAAARQTGSLNTGWRDIEAQGRALFNTREQS